MSVPNLQTLHRIQARTARMLAAGRETVAVGPFLATFHPTSDLPWLNYAAPAAHPPEERITPHTLAELRRVFPERGRVPRLEFIEALWPDLGATLESSGLKLQLRAPMMLCRPQDLAAVASPGVRIVPLDGNSDDRTLSGFLSALKRGFGHESDRVREEYHFLKQQL